MHYLSSVYFVSQPLHISGIFVAHHQDVYYIQLYMYTTIGTYCDFLFDCLLSEFHLNPANRQSTKKPRYIPIVVYIQYTCAHVHSYLVYLCGSLFILFIYLFIYLFSLSSN